MPAAIADCEAARRWKCKSFYTRSLQNPMHAFDNNNSIFSFWTSIVHSKQSDTAMVAKRTKASKLFKIELAACSNDRAAKDAR